MRWLRRQHGAYAHIEVITELQTDRGGEFTSGPVGNEKRRSVFDDYCIRKDISRRLTSALSPGQIGTSQYVIYIVNKPLFFNTK